MDTQIRNNDWLILLVVIAAIVFFGRTDSITTPVPDPDVPVIPIEPPPPVVVKPLPAETMAVVVYESEGDGVPLQVAKARVELEGLGYQVRAVDIDVVNPGGDRPTELVSALEAADSRSLPCLVVTNKGKVLLTVDLPASSAEIVKVVTK